MKTRSLWFPVAAGLALASIAGCGAIGLSGRSGSGRDAEEKVGPNKMTPSEIQSEVMTFCDTFNGVISQAWNQASSESRLNASSPSSIFEKPIDTARARRIALEIKLANATAAVTIASEPNPVVAVADMLTLVQLQRTLLDTPATVANFGAGITADLVSAYTDQENRIRLLADRVFGVEQRAELERAIAQWHADHPEQRYISQVRLEDFARERTLGVETNDTGNSVLSILGIDPLARLDPASKEVQKSRLLGERLFFYASRTPTLLKWQAESFVQNVTNTPESRQTLEALDRASMATDVLSKAAATLPEDVARERQATIEQIAAAVRAEREVTVNQISAELTAQRQALIDDLDHGSEKLTGTVKELHATIDSTTALTKSLDQTLAQAHALADRVLPPPSTTPDKPDPDRNAIVDFRLAVEKTGETVQHLTTLTEKVEHLLSTAPLERQAATIQTSVDSAEDSMSALIDRAFWRGLVLVVITLAGVAGIVWWGKRNGPRGTGNGRT